MFLIPLYSMNIDLNVSGSLSAKNNVVHCYINNEQGTEMQMIQSISKLGPNIKCGNVCNIIKHYFLIILCFIKQYLCVCFTIYIVLCSSDEICALLHLSPGQVQPEARIIFQLQWTWLTSVLALV